MSWIPVKVDDFILPNPQYENITELKTYTNLMNADDPIKQMQPVWSSGDVCPAVNGFIRHFTCEGGVVVFILHKVNSLNAAIPTNEPAIPSTLYVCVWAPDTKYDPQGLACGDSKCNRGKWNVFNITDPAYTCISDRGLQGALWSLDFGQLVSLWQISIAGDNDNGWIVINRGPGDLPPLVSSNYGTTWSVAPTQVRAKTVRTCDGKVNTFEVEILPSGGFQMLFNGSVVVPYSSVPDYYRAYIDPTCQYAVAQGVASTTGIQSYNKCRCTAGGAWCAPFGVLIHLADSKVNTFNTEVNALTYDCLISSDVLYMSSRSEYSDSSDQHLTQYILSAKTADILNAPTAITLKNIGSLQTDNICHCPDDSYQPIGVANACIKTNVRVRVSGTCYSDTSCSHEVEPVSKCYSRVVLGQPSYFSNPMPFGNLPLRLVHNTVNGSFFVVYANSVQEYDVASGKLTEVLHINDDEWTERSIVGYGLYTPQGSAVSIPIHCMDVYASQTQPTGQLSVDMSALLSANNVIQLFDTGRLVVSKPTDNLACAPNVPTQGPAPPSKTLLLDVFSRGMVALQEKCKTVTIPANVSSATSLIVFSLNGQWVLKYDGAIAVLYYNTWNSSYDAPVEFDTANPGFGYLCKTQGALGGCSTAYNTYCKTKLVQPDGTPLKYSDPMCACSNNADITNSLYNPKDSNAQQRAEMLQVAPCVYEPCAAILNQEFNYTNWNITHNVCDKPVTLCDTSFKAGTVANQCTDNKCGKITINNCGSNDPGTPKSPTSPNSGISLGAKIGIGIGAVVGFALLVALIIRLRQHSADTNKLTTETNLTTFDPTTTEK